MEWPPHLKMMRWYAPEWLTGPKGEWPSASEVIGTLETRDEAKKAVAMAASGMGNLESIIKIHLRYYLGHLRW